MKTQKLVSSVKQKIEVASIQTPNLDRETIKSWLENDIKSVYVLLAEILASQEIIDAVTNVFYAKYEELHKSTQPDLFDSKSETHGLKGDANDKP